jgi:hypothetical protein
MMKRPEKSLYSYIVKFDWGLAPNPWGRGTLAVCKPVIRRTAQEGDWIVGLSPKSDGYTLIFAMMVGEILTHGEYFRDSRFTAKKPNFQTSDRTQWVGDNFYEELETGYKQHLSGHSNTDGTENEIKKRRDLGGRNVLIASFLYYFGDQSPALSPKLDFLRTGRGHRRFGVPEILQFEKYAGRHLQTPGVFGQPTTLEKWTKPLQHFHT